jgi:uncharacterized repeat protein (TIGR03803 family)
MFFRNVRIQVLLCFNLFNILVANAAGPVSGGITANGPFCARGTGQLTWNAAAGTGPFTIVYNDGTANRTKSGVINGAPFNVFANPVTSTTTYTLVSVTDSSGDSASSGFSPAAAIIEVNDSFSVLIAGGITPICPNTFPGSFFAIDSGNGNKLTDTAVVLYPFSIDPNSHTVSGAVGDLLQASNGLLYGLLWTGGTTGYGSMFSFDPGTKKFLEIHSWDYTTGAYPKGSLIQAADGLLYGTTSSGGAYQYGNIFSYNITTGVLTTLFEFDDSLGGNPAGSLLQAADSLLYGLTGNGGANGWGVIFSFNIATNSYRKLHDLDGSADGGGPQGNLIQASNGLLYGMTEYGGTSPGAGGNGVLFSYNPASNIYRSLHTWNSTDGAQPLGSLVQASTGLLYGMTKYGGTNNFGVMFSYNIADSAYQTLKSFSDSTGMYPAGSLMLADNGLLYGMTEQGGVYQSGNLFSFNPFTGTFQGLYVWGGFTIFQNGGQPYGTLMQAGNGVFYGMLYAGGVNNAGVIFSYGEENNYQYKWFMDGSFTGDTLARFWPGALSANATVYCQLSSNSCNAVSNQIAITILPNPVANITATGDTLVASGGSAYQWFLNDDSLTGASMSQLIASASGNYTVIVSNDYGCSAKSATDTIAITAGLSQPANDNAVEVFPNPSDGKWWLRVAEDFRGSPAEVFDAAGNLIYQTKAEGLQMQIMLPGIPAGEYELRIAGPRGTVLKKLFKI